MGPGGGAPSLSSIGPRVSDRGQVETHEVPGDAVDTEMATTAVVQSSHGHGEQRLHPREAAIGCLGRSSEDEQILAVNASRDQHERIEAAEAMDRDKNLGSDLFCEHLAAVNDRNSSVQDASAPRTSNKYDELVKSGITIRRAPVELV